MILKSLTSLFFALIVFGTSLLGPKVGFAAIFQDRASFVSSFSVPGMTLKTDNFEDNNSYLFDSTSAGFTRQGIQYVGTQANYSADPNWNSNLFVYPYETYITPSGVSGFETYSLSGSKNLFGGRTSLDIDFPTGKVAFGFNLGFDTNNPLNGLTARSYDLPLSQNPAKTTMKVSFYNGTSVVHSMELNLGATAQFIGYQGSTITHVKLESLLPQNNADYVKDLSSGHGYWAYTLVDDVTFNSPLAAATPEPASLAIWGVGVLGCAVAGYRRRQKTRLAD